jgi:hypothetical protein
MELNTLDGFFLIAGLEASDGIAYYFDRIFGWICCVI